MESSHSGGMRLTKMQWESMEKHLNSSGKMSQDVHRCLFFKRSKKYWARKNIQPEELKGRIIFLSMFNDIDWKKNDENCISNAERVQNYAMKFSQGHWTFWGPGSEEKWYGSSFYAQKEEWGLRSQTKWYNDAKKLVFLCSKVSMP